MTFSSTTTEPQTSLFREANIQKRFMTPDQIVREIYKAIQSKLPPPLVAKLTFKDPDNLKKQGSNICRGRILPLRMKTVFDTDWCFFEVGIGRYAAGGACGVGFVCFPENKKCGKGIHSATISDLISRYAATHQGFVDSRRGEPAQCVFLYYPAIPKIEQLATALSTLIANTFPYLEQLTVSK